MSKEIEKIMNYLKGVAKQEPTLASRLEEKGIKTPQKMMTYIVGEAKKLCEKNENSVCIDDDTVYQWARHYWLDYEEKEVKEEKTEPITKQVKVVQTPKKEVKEHEQMSLFDFYD